MAGSKSGSSSERRICKIISFGRSSKVILGLCSDGGGVEGREVNVEAKCHSRKWSSQRSPTRTTGCRVRSKKVSFLRCVTKKIPT